MLPKAVRPKAPPIKTQGIKTKLVAMIASSVRWDGAGRWVEPFAGSGAVAFNLAPDRALLADANPHMIGFYRGVQSGEITGAVARRFLQVEGGRLSAIGERHYYFIRDRFNEIGAPLDFLFLSRACFNGVMRFNGKGGFNVPFCRKPDRFRAALVTKIANQIDWTAGVMAGKDWQFVAQPWEQTMGETSHGDMIYCDPPYVGRHADYYNRFCEKEADRLAAMLVEGAVPFALSMWQENKYRRNHWLDRRFDAFPRETNVHFYHVGASEDLRNEMVEALILSPDAHVEVELGLADDMAGLPLFEAV